MRRATVESVASPRHQHGRAASPAAFVPLATKTNRAYALEPVQAAGKQSTLYGLLGSAQRARGIESSASELFSRRHDMLHPPLVNECGREVCSACYP